MTASLGPRFEEAFAYAARAHAGQTKKGSGAPYIAHLMGVTAIVLEDGGDEEEAIAALLHDAVEDQGGHDRLSDIRRRFGDRVARIVESCTDSFTVPKRPWMDRKREYVEHARHLATDALRVSAADKVYNVRAILHDFGVLGDRLWSRFNAPPDQILWYYRSLVSSFRQSGGGALVDELEILVRDLAKIVERT